MVTAQAPQGSGRRGEGGDSAYPSSWWGSLEHPPWGISLHRGASTCNSTYWPDLKSSVSPNQHEFVAGILNMSDPAQTLELHQGTHRAPHHCQALSAQAALTNFPLLTVSFTAWKAALPLFSPSEDINSYSGQIRLFWLNCFHSTVLHPVVSFTSRSLWHCHPMNPRQMHE